MKPKPSDPLALAYMAARDCSGMHRAQRANCEHWIAEIDTGHYHCMYAATPADCWRDLRVLRMAHVLMTMHLFLGDEYLEARTLATRLARHRGADMTILRRYREWWVYQCFAEGGDV